jgi:hypothetical protein
MTTAKERRQEIGKVIATAMKALPDVNWAKESPAASESLDVMNEMIARYGEGTASREDCRQAYKNYLNACRGGLF